jgi:hypothetical protein
LKWWALAEVAAGLEFALEQGVVCQIGPLRFFFKNVSVNFDRRKCLGKRRSLNSMSQKSGVQAFKLPIVQPRLAAFALMFSMSLGSSTSSAQDLDIPAARARYERELQQTEQAKQEFQREESIHRGYQSQLETAQSREIQASNSLTNARNELDRIDRTINEIDSQISKLEANRTDTIRRRDAEVNELIPMRRRLDELQRQREDLERRERDLERRIADIQDRPHTGDYTCCAEDSGWEEHSGGHCATNSNRATAEANAMQRCRDSHGRCVARACQQPDSQELTRLRNELLDLRETQQRNRSEYISQQQRIDYKEREIRTFETNLAQIDRDISYKRSEQSQLRSSRGDAASRVSSAEDNLSRARYDVQNAQQQVYSHESILQSARQRWELADVKMREAYNYLQQVTNNYNSALNRVLATADQEATQHSAREAQDRAPTDAEAMGQRDARTVGEQMGSKDGGARDYARGYRAGRQSGSTSARLEPFYKEGLTLGQSSAESKAQNEDFPKGYNTAWDQLLSNAPEKSVTVDITDNVDQSPGDNGADLDPRKKPIGNAPSPDYPMPQDPAYNLPTAGTPSVSAPAPDYRHRNYPCSGLPLPEFEPKCRERYDATYRNHFASQFTQTFSKSYAASFNNSVKPHYDAALARSYEANKSRGEEQGAKDQGTLDGFAATLEQARNRQFQLGQAAVSNLLTTGHMLIVREVKLTEESGDGLFASGDRAKLRLVIDNYGLKTSPLGKARVRVTGKTNGESLSFELRDLPALAGNTRTVLDGVVAAKISKAKAQSKVSLEGVIELKLADGSYSELEKIKPEAEIRFPLEIQSLTLSKKPKVSEEVPAKLRITNNSTDKIDANEMILASAPATVSFGSAPVATPALNPGESIDLDVKVKPGVWVSDDIAVNILGTTKGVNGVVESTQIFPQIIQVERNAVLALRDMNGQPVPTGELKVVAGRVASFKVLFNFLASSRQPGPFVMRYTQSSDPSIRPANNSTTSVSFGSWSPGQRANPTTFSFDIPQSLRGKKGYILIQLDDGAFATHALQVGLDIQ